MDGASAGQYMNYSGAAEADILGQGAGAVGELHSKEQMFNADARMKADAMNSEMHQRTDMVNAEMDMMHRQQGQRYTDNIFGTVAGYGRDVNTGRQYASMMGMQSDLYSPRRTGQTRAGRFLAGERFKINPTDRARDIARTGKGGN
jgi:hypothetical protein